LKVLHVNVRLNEGGAAKVALALHEGMLSQGIESKLGYGWGEKAGKSSSEHLVKGAFQLGNFTQVVSNFFISRVVGIDVLPPMGLRRKEFIQALEWADIVHLHVIHSYYLPFEWLINHLVRLKKHVVWTSHDHWLVTGRCAFVDGCSRWKHGCGDCFTMKNYPPALIDVSSTQLRKKRQSLFKLGKQLTIATPSTFIARDIQEVLPDCNTVVIHNGVDSIIESLIRAHGNGEQVKGGPAKVLVIANDLSYQGKTNQSIVRRVMGQKDVVLYTVGKRSPFSGDNVINLGELRSRQELVDVYSKVDCMLFTSTVDSFGLVIAETLACGTPVVALSSDASCEVLGMVGGKTCTSIDEIIDVVSNKDWWSLYPNYSSESLAKKSLRLFSYTTMLSKYIKLYRMSR